MRNLFQLILNFLAIGACSGTIFFFLQITFAKSRRKVWTKYSPVIVVMLLYLIWFYWPQSGFLNEETDIVYEIDIISETPIMSQKTTKEESQQIIAFFNGQKLVRAAWKSILGENMDTSSDGVCIYFVKGGNYNLTNCVAYCPIEKSRKAILMDGKQLYYIVSDEIYSLRSLILK